MAISEYKTKNGETLYRVYVNVRSTSNTSVRAQRRIGGFKTRREAEREETKLLRECERELLAKEDQGETWGSVVESFGHPHQDQGLDSLSPISRQDYVALATKHTFQWWRRPAKSLSRNDFRELLQTLKLSGISYAHVKKMKLVCNRIYDFGIMSGKIQGVEFSPLKGIALGRETETKPEILTLNEIRKLLQCAKEMDHPWYPVWALALLTGMRSGELYALEWKDVDWENKAITVSKSYNCRFRCIKSTKAGYWRTVPISTDLHHILDTLKRDSQTRASVLPRTNKWTKGLQARELRKFCIGLGLPSIRFHALRACFATQLIRNGVPPIQIQKICGWRDLKTMQRYIRLAGIEIEGATEDLKLIPESELPIQAAKLFQVSSESVA